MPEQIVYALIAGAIMVLVGFPIHEFMHAFAAYRLGDSTARWQGRLTLDPRKHFDPLGGGMLFLSAILSRGGLFLGWAKPTPVNPMNLAGGRRGEALVAVAGPLSNLVMAAVVAVPLRLVTASPLIDDIAASWPAQLAYNVLFFFVVLNIFLFIFNLIPIPPLDGWRVLLGLAPPQVSYQLRSVEQYAFLGLIVLLFAGGAVISPIAGFFIDLLLGDGVGIFGGLF
ncbi:MAG: site-2 protease family protein [Chloroflexota bacterium]|nr:site-2 protease family protein [Chloroflexota bacterium]